MPTVLILVRDVGFQFWLGQALISSGFGVVPAKTPSQALKLIDRVGMPVDLALIDPRMGRIGPFVDALRERQGYLRVLSIPTEGRLPQSGNAGGQPPEPVIPDPQEWVNLIRRSLTITAGSF
jgi:hypothetical protein